MIIRPLAAGLLAGIVLCTGAAHACTDSCPPGTAPSYPVLESAPSTAETAETAAAPPAAPLRLSPQRKKSQPKRTVAQPGPRETTPVADATPTQLPLPRPRPDTDESWPASVYGMDPALASPQAAAPEPPPAFPRSVTVADTHEVNDIARMADTVRVVSADEVNEIDLAASVQPVAETSGQAQPAAPATEARVAAPPQGLPTSWIAGLVMAFGGVAAAASALFIRQTRTSA
jgi:hypothetical protein